MLQISVSNESGVTVVAIKGRLDAGAARGFQTDLLEVIGLNPQRLVLECSGMDYISSAGLRVFLMAAKRTGAAGSDLVICGLGDTTREVFDVTGFTKLFTIKDTLREVTGA